MKKLLFHNRTFWVVMFLGALVEALFIYLTIDMSKKSKDDTKSEHQRNQAKNYSKLFIVLSIIWVVFLCVIMFDHFKHRDKQFT